MEETVTMSPSCTGALLVEARSTSMTERWAWWKMRSTRARDSDATLVSPPARAMT